MVDDKIRYGEMISSTEVSDEALLVKKEIAKKMKEEAGEAHS